MASEREISALLEEVDTLLAHIESTADLPYAHLAAHQAALATRALETELVRVDDNGSSSLSTNLSTILPLKILREITTPPATLSPYQAIKSGNIGLVWLLLETSTLINEQENNKLFQFACARGRTDIVQMFLERGINPSADGNRALKLASDNGRTDIICLLLELPLEYGIDPAQNKHTLQRACLHGFTEIVRLFLERGVNVIDNGPFREACSNGHTDIAKMLLEYGVNPAADKNDALRFATIHGRTHIVRLLLSLDSKYGINPADVDENARLYAKNKGHTEICEMLRAKDIKS